MNNVNDFSLNFVTYEGIDIYYSITSEQHGSRMWTRYNIYSSQGLKFERVGALLCPNPITTLELALRAYNVLRLHNRGVA